MSEANKPQQQQNVQLHINEAKMETTYANMIRTSFTPEEVVLDFGMNLPIPTQDGQPAIMFNVGSRVVLNWRGAKRLAMNLAQVVRNYEEQNGTIDIGQAQQGGPGGGPRLAN